MKIQFALLAITAVSIFPIVPAQADSLASKAICSRDYRPASNVGAVMRLRPSLEDQERACTAFLIGKSCALTAGHCKESLRVAEFSPPDGDGSGFLAAPASAENVYHVDPRSIKSEYSRTGEDFAVFKLAPNAVTGLYPGEVHQPLELEYMTPDKGEEVSIVGYGTQYTNRKTFLSQKFSTGEVLDTFYRRGLPFISNLSSVSYTAGSTGGDSGAPVIRNRTGKVIGIHNSGGCHLNRLRNSGTLFDRQVKLKRAIQACLRSE